MSEPASGTTARLFVAVVPPPDVLEQVAALPRPPAPGVRYTRREQWHVTLRFLGTAPVVDAARRVHEVVAAATEAVMGPTTARLGRQVVCLAVDGLADLAAAVVRATADVGRPPERRPFHGHLTVARLGRAAHAPPAGLVGVPFLARFEVKEIHLVRSVLDRRGATYETVAVHHL